jgi:hypothetical protein
MKSILPILLFIVIIFGCSDDDQQVINSTSQLSDQISNTSYYQESVLDESETFSFSNGNFTKTYKNKRSGQTRSFSGTYKVLEGKYTDDGERFFYVRLVGDSRYSNEFGNFNLYHLVLCESGNLCPPMENGFSVDTEDEYGLKIKHYMVSLWCDDSKRYSYSPTNN